MNTFTLYTNNHDVDGTPSQKQVPNTFKPLVRHYLQLHTKWIAIQQECLEALLGAGDDQELRHKLKKYEAIRRQIIARMFGCGIFTNKWDIRTTWVINDNTQLR